MKKILFRIFALVAAVAFVGCDIDETAGLSSIAYYVQFDTPSDKYVEVGTSYTLPTVEATVNGEPFTLAVEITDADGDVVSSIDTTEVGVFLVTYTGYYDDDPAYPTTTTGSHYVFVYTANTNPTADTSDDTDIVIEDEEDFELAHVAAVDAIVDSYAYGADFIVGTYSLVSGKMDGEIYDSSCEGDTADSSYADAGYTITISKVVDGIYKISDLTAGWYSVHEAYGSSYAQAAYVAVEESAGFDAALTITPIYYITPSSWSHLASSLSSAAFGSFAVAAGDASGDVLYTYDTASGLQTSTFTISTTITVGAAAAWTFELEGKEFTIEIAKSETIKQTDSAEFEEEMYN